MNILIVHANPELRETIAHLVQNQRRDAMALMAGCLDQAMEHVDWAHAVLAHDSFRTHAVDHGEPVETQRGNWASLMMAAEKAGVPIVIFGEQRTLIARLREAGHHAFPMPGELLSAIQAALDLAEIKSFDAEVLDIEPGAEAVQQPVQRHGRRWLRKASLGL